MRRRYTQFVAALLSAELLAKLDRLAAMHDRSRSSTIRHLVREACLPISTPLLDSPARESRGADDAEETS
ncbi:MAG: ribbon-helix-helix protein, CopG family [Chloroflexi bacterium]|nr:ribbon-helix-helix protein, CopG family [Chloroflexota bacterium]